MRRMLSAKGGASFSMDCPVLYEVMTGGDKDGMIEMEFGTSAVDADHGFGVEVPLSDKLPLLLCLTPFITSQRMLTAEEKRQ